MNKKLFYLVIILLISSCSSDDDGNNNNIPQNQNNEIVFEGESRDIGWAGYYIYNETHMGQSAYGVDIYFFPNSIIIDDTYYDNLRGNGWFVTLAILDDSNSYADLNDISGSWNNPFCDLIDNVSFSVNESWEFSNTEQFVMKNVVCTISKNGDVFEITVQGVDDRGVDFSLYYKGTLTDHEVL